VNHSISQTATYFFNSLLGEKTMQSSIQRIGVIGVGHMGGDFASNLMADGFQVKVYDRK
jgi:phosphoglycerate dehydrogenase-like enzyme